MKYPPCSLHGVALLFLVCGPFASVKSQDVMLDIEALATGDIRVSWPGIAGRTFVLNHADDLGDDSWLITEAPIDGSGTSLARVFGIGPGHGFFRLSYTDDDLFAVEDYDGDGIPTAWEIANLYDPINPGTAKQDIDRDGRSTLAEYRGETSATNPDAAARSFLYDDDGRLIRVIYPDGKSIAYTYDPAGNITSSRVETH